MRHKETTVGTSHKSSQPEEVEAACEDTAAQERDILKQVEDWRAGKLETYSLEEVRHHLGLDD